LRKRRGLSQSQLARRAAGSIARTYLSKAECGHVLLPLSKLLPIAGALGLTAVILRFETTTSLASRQSNDPPLNQTALPSTCAHQEHPKVLIHLSGIGFPPKI
jgi:transcriptional regulator with XRE-family HTH domain